MLFRTEIQADPFPQQLDIQDNTLLLGSCFAEHMGQGLEELKLSVLVNPAGIIFNPISLFSFLEKSIKQELPKKKDFVERDQISYHYAFHSDLADQDWVKLAEKITDIYQKTTFFLNKSHFLYLTFGTAYVYERLETQEIVANCHKMPSHYFEKRLLNVSEIIHSFEKIYALLPPNLQLVLTLSPVRHLKDTLPLNSLSKAVLRLAIYEICSKFKNVHYFPAYELLLDDLRDYRFYASDLLHPNEQAIDYIFEKFATSFFSPALKEFQKKWLPIKKALAHKPFWAESEKHQAFLKNLLAKLDAVTEVNVEREKEIVRKQIK